MVSPLEAARCNTVPNAVPVLASTFESIFCGDVNARSLLGDIVKHWLTTLVEETNIDQKTVGRFYDGDSPF